MSPFAGMSARELELLRRSINKANPPPLLHRYRRASEWAIKELSVPEVHIAGVEDMNDPFEYRAPLKIDIEKLKRAMYDFAREQRGMNHDEAQQEAASVDLTHAMHLQNGIEALRTASGLICCSTNPRSNRMWAYYGDAHKGICIGYNTHFAPFCLARQVSYVDPTDSIDLLETLKQDPTLLSDRVSCRKGAEWEFEQEFRIPVGPFSENHTRLLRIQHESIAEIRLGARICPDFKDRILKVAGSLPHRPQIIQLGCDHKTFCLTESNL